MNSSWTAQSGNLLLSLGVKTLWKTKLWLIRAQSNESWSWSNCVWKNQSLTWPRFLSSSGVFCRVEFNYLRFSTTTLWRRISLEHSIYTLCKHSYLPHRGFSNDVLWTPLITANKSLSLSTAIFALHVIHVLLSGLFVVASFIQWHA